MAETTASGAGAPAKSKGRRKTGGKQQGRKSDKNVMSATHGNLKSLLGQFDQAKDKDAKVEALKALHEAWARHAEMEEDELFPALKEKGAAGDAIAMAEVEHDIARLLLQSMEARQPDDDYFNVIAKAFRDTLNRIVALEARGKTGLAAQAQASGADLSKYKAALDDKEGGAHRGSRSSQSLSLRILGRSGSSMHKQEVSPMANRMRDERGRFTDDDDDYRGSRSSYRGSSSGNDDRRSSGGRSDREGSGWYGDSRGHSEAAHRGWEHRREDDDDDYRSSSRRSQSRYEDDDDNGRSSSSRGRGHGGWFGDSEGHSRAARGQSSGSGSGSGYRSQSRYEDDDEGDYDRRRNRMSSSRDDEDDDRRSSSSRGGGSGHGGSGHGGWFGDSEGHSRAARRGRDDRDDDDYRRGGRR